MGEKFAEHTSTQMEGLQQNRVKKTSSSATCLKLSISLKPHLSDHDVSTRANCGNRAERKRKSGKAGFFLAKICKSRAQSQTLFWHVLAMCYVLEHMFAELVIPAVTYTVIHARARAHAPSIFSIAHTCACAHTHCTRHIVHWKTHTWRDCL